MKGFYNLNFLCRTKRQFSNFSEKIHQNFRNEKNMKSEKTKFLI